MLKLSLKNLVSLVEIFSDGKKTVAKENKEGVDQQMLRCKEASIRK
jgi:hypothetical protein